MNERHKGQLKIAHQIYDNRDLKQELLWQREFLDTGYLSWQQVCFNKWIFDECLKRLETLEKIEQIMAKYQDTLDRYYSGEPRDLLESDVLRDIKRALGKI